MQLSDYLLECQRLLHDANNNFWSVAELTTYINDARNQVAADTHCLRQLATVNLSYNVETYAINSSVSLPGGRQVLDILNITVLWGSMRIPLIQMSWTEFNAKMRAWVLNYSRPAAMSRYGTSNGTIYVQPIPDQAYVSEWDVCYLPLPLVNSTDTETDLSFPFTSPVAYYACYKAKEKEQAYGEAKEFHEQYKQKAMLAINQSYTRVMPNPYT
jgi:hypothetical protein